MRRAVAAIALTLLCACYRQTPPDRSQSYAEVERLNQAYSQLLANLLVNPALTPMRRAQLMADQDAFTRHAADCGPSPAGNDCMISAYSVRITELRAFSPT